MMEGGSGLPRAVVDDIEAAGIVAGRPLLAVDADEVLVEFAAHLGRWLLNLGYELKLTRYELEGAIFSREDGEPVAFDGALALIDAFFEEETERQSLLDGAAEAVARLGGEAQVVVLTNIPRPARDARVRNLTGHGLAVPVIANTGGKGRALRMLAEQAAAPAVFVDDSPGQIASAARHADGVCRLHFRGSPYIRSVLQPADDADQVVEDWRAAEQAIRRHLLL